ncbi:MAG: hypothetical protein ABI366_04345 [Ginsengibacter sp.]
MKKINISFSKFSDANFQNKGKLIYDSMNANQIYASLAAEVAAMKIALDDFTDNLAAAGTNDRTAVAQKNQSRQELTLILKQLGLNVMVVAKGDTTALVSSGYTLSKKPEPRYIYNPGNVTLSRGVSTGELISTVIAVAGAKSYVHQITTELPSENAVWTSNTSSASKFTFTNLIPGKQYWLRVGVVGARNQVAYSSVGTWFAQ